MRKLLFALPALTALFVATAFAWAGEPSAGTLSVERGKGLVTIELRGSVLGRIGTGTLRVTDLTPNDRFAPLVVGRRMKEERLGPRTVLYRGQGLRFRLVGGGYRMVARGSGMAVSAVGRGWVVLDGDPRFLGDEAGIYSFDGVDCGVEPLSCTPLPTEPERFLLEPPPEEPPTPKARP
jgi:hypothetical protein